MKQGQFSFQPPALAGVFICVLLWLTGCAAPQTQALALHWPADLPSRAAVPTVPFFAQEDFECGPAALAMVLQAAGVAVLPDQLTDQVYLPARKGSLQVEMLAASRRYGIPTYVLAPTVDAVLREVAAGHPVLVFQNLSLPWYPVWHYAVVIGFDRDANTLTLHSGRTPDMPISPTAFENTWARGGHWAMLAIPPVTLPATATPDAVVQSLAALERVQPGAAQKAYAGALARWPDNRTLLLGHGNAAYATGDLESAEQILKHTVLTHPEFADAWNNLAQVLLDRGKVDEAAQAISQAVALGGMRLPVYQQLQEAIFQRTLPSAR